MSSPGQGLLFSTGRLIAQIALALVLLSSCGWEKAVAQAISPACQAAEVRILVDSVVVDAVTVREVESVVWQLVQRERARLVSSSSFRSDPASHMVRRVPHDSAYGRRVARALRELLRGTAGLFGSEYARVAARLYRELHLPPGPALVVLCDPNAPVFSRTQALGALHGEVGDAWLGDVVVGLVEELGRRATGRLVLDSTSRGLQAIRDAFDDDEFQFFSRVAAVFESYADHPQLRRRLEASIGVTHPFLRAMQQVRNLQ